MSEREVMLSGKPYQPWAQELQDDRDRARQLIERYNMSKSSDKAQRSGIIASLFGKIDKGHPPHLESPFYCDYGYNLSVGKDFYCNFACALLDGGRITIGDRVLFGPNVHLYTPTHPLDPAERNGLQGPEMTKPITIGNDVWVAGGAIILPGVTVGDGCTIGAGSVVTRDVEPYTVVAGNPAKVIRRLPRKVQEQASAQDSQLA
ncbi:hypothetical protein ABBQ38_009815 [Trebouxia sp. C0009 RCD-2024]